MDTTAAKGVLKEVAGKVQESVGSGLADTTTQLKGVTGQAVGHAQEFAGNAAEKVRNTTSGSPLMALAIVAVSSFVLGMVVTGAGSTRRRFR